MVERTKGRRRKGKIEDNDSRINSTRKSKKNQRTLKSREMFKRNREKIAGITKVNRPLSPRALHGRQKLSIDSRGRTIRPIRTSKSLSEARSPRKKHVGDLLEQELKNEERKDQNRLLFSNEDSGTPSTARVVCMINISTADDEEASLEYAHSRKNSPHRQRLRAENNYHMRNRLSRINRSIRGIRKSMESKTLQPRDDGNLILQIRRRDNSVSQTDGHASFSINIE